MTLDRETKRFLAAAMAMQGMLARPVAVQEPTYFALASVQCADALLAVLDEKKESQG